MRLSRASGTAPRSATFMSQFVARHFAPFQIVLTIRHLLKPASDSENPLKRMNEQCASAYFGFQATISIAAGWVELASLALLPKLVQKPQRRQDRDHRPYSQHQDDRPRKEPRGRDQDGAAGAEGFIIARVFFIPRQLLA